MKWYRKNDSIRRVHQLPRFDLAVLSRVGRDHDYVIVPSDAGFRMETTSPREPLPVFHVPLKYLSTGLLTPTPELETHIREALGLPEKAA